MYLDEGKAKKFDEEALARLKKKREEERRAAWNAPDAVARRERERLMEERRGR